MGGTISDLNALLEEISASPPYIFVGHSFGCIIIRHFLDAYPHQVAGVVFADPIQPRHLTELPIIASIHKTKRFRILVSKLARALPGVMRPLAILAQPAIRYFSRKKYHCYTEAYGQEVITAVLASPFDTFLSTADEFDLLAETLETTPSELPDPDLPLAIVAAETPFARHRPRASQEEIIRYTEIHHNLQKELLNLSHRSSFTISRGSDHNVPVSHPETLIQTIQAMADTRRKNAS